MFGQHHQPNPEIRTTGSTDHTGEVLKKNAKALAVAEMFTER